MSILTLEAFEKVVRASRPVVYYLTNENCPPADEASQPLAYWIAPNLTSSHAIILMHPDNLPAFQAECAKIGITAIDQHEYWKNEQIAFDNRMTDNAWSYGQMLLDRHDTKKEPPHA